MNKFLRIALFVVLILIPIIFYKSFYKGKQKKNITFPVIVTQTPTAAKPKIALVFDDLGESLQELEEIYSLHTPLTISIIPGLKFSKNIAYISSNCGFSVLIHLPLEPKDAKSYLTKKYQFISASLSKREIDSLLRRYLNSIRLAIGANNHMGSAATENPELMRMVLHALHEKNLFFIDSCTSLKSVACDIAKNEGVTCAYNTGFMDSIDNPLVMRRKLKKLVRIAKKKGKIIVIVHPRKTTIAVLRDNLPELKKEVDFITVKDYFGT
jgi:polysaccharide deacetylase 2 family uncharacterized protein YibQ